MDSLFWYTLLFIFISALVGTFLNSRQKDRCLIDFEKFQVTIEETDGDLAWGTLNVYFTGIEVQYPSPQRDNDGHIECSYIIYKEQYSSIQGIYRYHDALSEKNQKAREISIRKTYHPHPFRRLRRHLRNILNTFKDSILQSIGLIVGQAQKANPKSTILKTQDKRITSLTQDIIQVTANAYEPILEKYIGKRVVLDVNKGGQEIEHSGILKEYTYEFIEVLDIMSKERKALELNPESDQILRDFGMQVTREDLHFIIENRGSIPMYLRGLESPTFHKDLNVICTPGATVDFCIEKEIRDKITLSFEIARRMDAIIPRSHCLVRHSGECESLEPAAPASDQNTARHVNGAQA